MELRVLKYFLMTAREENITRAAEQLHMTQPTLSRQLAKLEEELGVKLFRRRFLSQKMKTFRQQYPLVTFQIYSANADAGERAMGHLCGQ